MASSGEMRRIGGEAARWVAVCAAYVAAAQVGLYYATIGGAVSLVWPPSGLAIAAVFLWGRPYALAVAVGGTIANYGVAASLPQALLSGVGNATEAVIGAALLGAFGVSREFRRRRDVLGLAAAAALSPIPAALMGATAIVAFGDVASAEFGRAALQWWAGDASGAVLLVPLLLTLSAVRERIGLLPVLSLNLAIAGSALVAFVLFAGSEASLALAVLPYGFLLWSALRYGTLGASSTAFTLSAVVAACTAAGVGPFAGSTSVEALWSLWLFIAVTGTFSLVITALDNERAAADRAHVSLERRFRRAFEDAPTGMAILDADRRLVAANATFRHLLGASDPIDATLDRWTDEAGAERLAAALDHPGADSRSVSVVFRSETGTVRHCVVWFAPLSTPGSPGTVLAHVEDITPARLAERDKQRLTEQLVHSQRMDGIGQLAGGVAHDLNNILQAVSGNLELIAAGRPGDPNQAHWVAAARHAATRASAMTRQLLAFSRRAPMMPEVVDLGEAVRSSSAMLARLLPERVHLEVDVADGLFVMADAAQVEQVLLNLVVNARDAMGDEGRILVVAWRVPETGRVELFVEDEGPGIEPALRERVFEPFFTTKEPGRGTGLGLAVAYGIAHAHGGRIWAEDGTTGGARVVLSLPPASGPLPDPSDAPPVDARRRTVLVAEDDPDVLDVAEQLLSAEGYQVLTARDGIEAIEQYQAAHDPIDVVVFDVVMPRLSGAEALRAIASHGAHVPAVLVSGYARDLADPSALKDLGVEFLVKPYTQAQLVGAIARALGRVAEA